MSDEENDSNGVEEASEEETENNEDGDAESEVSDAPNPLTEEVVGECLSLLCKIGSGLSHAYVKLDIKERDITDVSLLERYVHLRYVDVSKNLIRDLSPLAHLTHLLLLRADMNKLSGVALEPLPYLQVASFTGNALKNTDGMNHPLLEQLNLSYNQITEVTNLNSTILQRLHTLELRSNQLESTAGIHLECLKNLFLGANLIKKLEGLEHLPNLSTLHLRDNQLQTLDGFSSELRSLQYVNIRGNHITDAREINKLSVLPQLRALVMSENPVCDEDTYRLDTLVALPGLERLDKDEVNDDERNEAREIIIQKQKEAEEAQQESEGNNED